MAAVARDAAALGAFLAAAFVLPSAAYAQAQDVCSMDPDLCPIGSAASESCEDTPGWDNGVTGCRERGFSEADGCGANGWTCQRYAAKWCKDGKVIPGMEFSLGARFKYPEQHCCVCGGGVRKVADAAVAKPAPPAKPVESTKAAAPVQPAKPAEPTKPAAPAKPAAPVEQAKPADLGFIRSKGTYCKGNTDNVLNYFPDPDMRTSMEKCEAFCAKDSRCWGCSIHCTPACQWNAIPNCGERLPFPGMINGDITQKPRAAAAAAATPKPPPAQAKATHVMAEAAGVASVEEAFVVDNTALKSLAEGIEYRTAKRIDARAGEEHYVAYGSTIKGVDMGDGWVQVGKFYLPTHVRGVKVLVKKEQPTTTTTTVAKPKEETFLVDNSVLKSPAEGIEFRKSKKIDDRAGEQHFVAYGKTLTGTDEGDGWLKVGQFYLPMSIRGIQVVKKQEPVAASGKAACTDTPDWTNAFTACGEKGFNLDQGCVVNQGFNCQGYVLQGWCSGTGVIAGMEWATGSGFKSPELNCCACGGGNRAA